MLNPPSAICQRLLADAAGLYACGRWSELQDHARSVQNEGKQRFFCAVAPCNDVGIVDSDSRRRNTSSTASSD